MLMRNELASSAADRATMPTSHCDAAPDVAATLFASMVWAER